MFEAIRSVMARWGAAFGRRGRAHEPTFVLRFARLPSRPLRYQLVRSVFLRGLGAVYLIAFTSLERQVLGLYGRRGILPASEFLERVRSVVGTERYREFPTLLWIDDSDRALLLHCKAGRFTALALLFDVAPRTSALILWTLYLSLVTVGQEFLAFQWDVLLHDDGEQARLEEQDIPLERQELLTHGDEGQVQRPENQGRRPRRDIEEQGESREPSGLAVQKQRPIGGVDPQQRGELAITLRPDYRADPLEELGCRKNAAPAIEPQYLPLE